MYIPKSFAESDAVLLYQFMRDHNFASLVAQQNGHIIATHLPFLIDADNGLLRAHLARANDQWKAFDRSEALVIFQGPHAYISPTWYETHPSVPTWNYTAVHVYGTPQIITDETRIKQLLGELVENHEHHRQPEWTMNLPEDYFQKQLQAIVTFEIPIARIEGKFKLSQNRSETDQVNVIAQLSSSVDPLDVQTAQLAAHRRANR